MEAFIHKNSYYINIRNWDLLASALDVNYLVIIDLVTY